MDVYAGHWHCYAKLNALKRKQSFERHATVSVSQWVWQRE